MSFNQRIKSSTKLGYNRGGLEALVKTAKNYVTPNKRPSGFDLLGWLTNINLNGIGINKQSLAKKYSTMAASPFAFYRGTDELFFYDWIENPALDNFGSTSAITWLSGDCHVMNFGSFKNGNSDLVYQLNDFDVSAVGRYQYDVWRLATSLVLVSEELSMPAESGKWIESFARSYAKAAQSFTGKNSDKSLTDEFTIDGTHGVLKQFLQNVQKDSSQKKLLSKWTAVSGGVRKFIYSAGKLVVLEPDIAASIKDNFEYYLLTLYGRLRSVQYSGTHFFDIKDIARRVGAGNGSTGMARFYVLIEGPSNSEDDDIILDVKQGGYPALRRFLKGTDLKQYQVCKCAIDQQLLAFQHSLIICVILGQMNHKIDRI